MKLARGKSYMTTATREEVEASVELSPLVVLTPYRSRCSDAFDGSGRTTPRRLLESLDGADVAHVLVEDCELMEEFGYLDDLQTLVQRGVSLVLLNTRESPRFVEAAVLSLNRLFIRLEGDDRFVALFVLCRIYGRIVVVCRETRRVEMFAEIFRLEVDAVHHGERVQGRVVVVMDRFVDADCEKLFYIGEGSNGLRRTAFNLGRAGKFLHRIRDVCAALSHAVVSGKRELNMRRFDGVDR